MPNAGLTALLALLGFALVFAVLPSGPAAGSQTGAQLSGVRLQLFPANDTDAVWRFDAREVSSDPVAQETRLSGISGGERVLVDRASGRETLDARLSTPELTIDGDDNMTTRQARITLVGECADIDLKSRDGVPVRIEQGVGFSAPVAEISSPLMNGHAEKLRMSFGFVSQDVDDAHTRIEWDLDGREQCVDGRRVTRPAGT